jgi:2-polyprenyl-3-methyl-5-hydroxy-6-metoxy-1,4-benzoquinol methylase
MSFFSQYPEFVEQDSRKDRGFSQVTIETLDNRHQVSAPSWLVDGMTVLDLGSCLGATGHWVLSHGCTHYTGVEVQPELAATSRTLLSKYWKDTQYSIVEQDLRSFLDQEIAAGKKYDVIVMVGVIYAFLDTYNILSKLAEICDYSMVIDSIYPWNMTTPDVPIIDVIRWQHINSSDSNTAFQGAGSRPAPNALRIMMETLGYENKEGLLYPKPVENKDVHDSYITPIERPGSKSYKLPARYMMRFYKTEQTSIKQVGDYVVSNNKDKKVEMAKAPPVAVADTWVFDETVAKRFQQEAETHIPDYARVIKMCMEYTNQVYNTNKSINIIDVGSALGNTMDSFISQGYTNVTGVDNSQSMIASSKYPDQVTLSNTFPQGQYDVVLANWTLHFVTERKQYIQDIYDSMTHNGMLILSDKMDHSLETENLYYDFKRANGVPEDVIQKKKTALVGVLVTKPLQWYLDTLKEIGFTDIQVINSRFMFSTIYARKL